MVQGRMFVGILLLVAHFNVDVAVAKPKIEAVPGEYLVKVKNQTTFQSLIATKKFNAEKISVVSRSQNILLIKKNILERQDFAISQLSSSTQVELVEPNYIYRVSVLPNDPKLDELWGLRNSAQKGGRAGIDIGAEAAWDITTGNQSILVAVIDTGLDYTHPDLLDNAWVNELEANGQTGVDDDGNGYVDDIHGYDFVNNDGDPMDDHGHGSHVAGTIGAKGNDEKGIVGVAWNVRIAGVKFLSRNGSGTLENAIRAIDYATSIGARIQNNSWGGGAYSELLLAAIVRAKEKEVLFVAAAGNESNNNDANPSYPATYDVDNILSVAALDNSGALADFSNYGKTKVHVAAPGVDITSSVPFTISASGYATWSGTSMAAPHVSGVAVLLMANNPNILVSEVKNQMIMGSRVLSPLRSKLRSAGMVNAYYALSGEVPPVDMEDPFNWEKQEYILSSAHPYENSIVAEYEIMVPEANQFSVYFEKFETERGYDIVEFVDASGNILAKWTGNHSGEYSPVINGDYVKLLFKSDSSVTGYGFDITKIAAR